MISPDTAIWLQERTALGILSSSVLDAIAEVIEEQVVPEQTQLVNEGTQPEALYIIKEGRIETSSTSNNSAPCCGLLPGTVVNLKEFLLQQDTQYTVTTLSECHLWVVPGDKFREIINQHPEIAQAGNILLADELAQLASALSYEQECSLELRPYLVTKAKRGIVGTSKYAKKLREQIREATTNRESVLIFGEPGLEKDNIAALIHYGSSYRHEPIIKVNCGILQISGADLFGRYGGKPGLLEYLENGTLVLNNLQELPKELSPSINNLIKTGTYTSINRDNVEIHDLRLNHAKTLTQIVSKAT